MFPFNLPNDFAQHLNVRTVSTLPRKWLNCYTYFKAQIVSMINIVDELSLPQPMNFVKRRIICILCGQHIFPIDF